MDDVIIIDSDDDDLDRKPAAKKSGDDDVSKKRSARNLDVECISLVDDEDKKISADDINIPKSNEDEFISLLDSGEGKKKSATANSDEPCVSLLDSSDEENFDNSGSYGMLSPKSRKRRRAEEADRKLAQQLQAQEDKAGTKANSRKEKKAMAKSTDGKSVLAVQQIIALVKTAKDKYVDNNVGLHQHIHANNMNPAYMRGAASATSAAAAAVVGGSAQETIEAVTIDDMVFFCKNMLEKQTEMIENGVSGFIDIGYHYTDHRNMDNIRTHGLMTKAERTQGNVVAASKGAVFGDGIYTANNCKNFSNFGPAGLIVARLQGKAVRAASYLPPNKLTGIKAHTIIGDKMTGALTGGVDSDGWPTSDNYHEIVLRHSSQCLPMIKFDRALISNKDGEACLQFIEKSLKEIINKLFNKGVQTNNVRDAPFIVPPVQRRYPAVPAAPPSVPLPPGGRLPPSLPASLAARMGLLPGVSGAPLPLPGPGSATGSIGFAPPPVGAWKRRKKTSSSTAATSMANARSYQAPMTTQTLNYTAPTILNVGVPDNALTPPPMSCNLDDDCVICMEKLKKRRKCAALPCKHVFHKQCLELAFKSKPQCPVCRISIGQAQGKSPSGTMTVFVSSIRFSGFNEDSITITYNMPSGTQMSYHDNPNTRHSSKFVSAYLPNKPSGRELLKRLKFAFMHGLTFTVGTSATSGQTNQITWSSVHHKTAPSGGVHGFPDPNYFTNCHGELDGLNVPPARDLDDDGKKTSG